MSEPLLDEYDEPGRPVYNDDDLLTPGELAALFRVDPKTASRWAGAGRIPDIEGESRPSVIRTPGGHIRVRYHVVRLILEGKIEMGYAQDPVAMPPQPMTRGERP